MNLRYFLSHPKRVKYGKFCIFKSAISLYRPATGRQAFAFINFTDFINFTNFTNFINFIDFTNFIDFKLSPPLTDAFP